MQHPVELVATVGIFQGLAKQNMLFHQCIGELVDNSIASKKKTEKFRIEIFLLKDSDLIKVYIADNSQGMSLETLKDALQLGRVPNSESDRLHEHGFGLKNSLATLTRGTGYWKLWTKDFSKKTVNSVEGPFSPKMSVEDDDSFPNEDFLPLDLSTLILVETNLDFLRTVQGRGGPTKDLYKLRKWLIEHLGVYYRGYLDLDSETFEPEGAIFVSIGKDRKRVPPVKVPFGNKSSEYIEVELSGEVYKLTYEFGTLDEVKRDKLIGGEKASYYYQKNIPTQGIDIRLGKRTIATAQFNSIWKTQDGKSQLNRHNNYNDFIGELIIPNTPRGVLSTVNNKTDFNLDDPDWAKIFEKLNEYHPPKKVREKSEKALQEKWAGMLNATNPNDTVSMERCVWPTGVRIDVYRKTENNNVIIYELKVGNAQPIHVYQLKMYWDGLEIEKERPREAILLVEDYSSVIEEMITKLNSELKTPSGNEYNLKIEKHKDKGL